MGFLVESLGIYNYVILLSKNYNLIIFSFLFIYFLLLSLLYWSSQDFIHNVQNEVKSSLVSHIIETAFRFSQLGIMLATLYLLLRKGKVLIFLVPFVLVLRRHFMPLFKYFYAFIEIIIWSLPFILADMWYYNYLLIC